MRRVSKPAPSLRRSRVARFARRNVSRDSSITRQLLLIAERNSSFALSARNRATTAALASTHVWCESARLHGRYPGGREATSRYKQVPRRRNRRFICRHITYRRPPSGDRKAGRNSSGSVRRVYIALVVLRHAAHSSTSLGIDPPQFLQRRATRLSIIVPPLLAR